MYWGAFYHLKVLNTVSRLRLILPPDCQHNEGFVAAIHTLKTVAAVVGAEIEASCIDGDPSTLETEINAIEPAVPTTVGRIDDWHALLDLLKTETRPRTSRSQRPASGRWPRSWRCSRSRC